MIDIRELAKYQYADLPVRIVCHDGQVVIGKAGEVDDEEESGLGEPGITVYLEDGGLIGVGISEIKSVDMLPNVREGRKHIQEALVGA